MEKVEPMASALFSRRNISAGAAAAANKNKTNTFCLVLGLIFIPRPRFFRPPEQEVHTAFHVGILVPVKMQFRDPPELEAASQLTAEVSDGMLQCRQCLILGTFITAEG